MIRFNLTSEHYAEDWLVQCDEGWLCRTEDAVAEQRKLLAEASTERAIAQSQIKISQETGAIWKRIALQLGACGSCALGLPIESQGCTDCLGTGLSSEYHTELNDLKAKLALVESIVRDSESQKVKRIKKVLK